MCDESGLGLRVETTVAKWVLMRKHIYSLPAMRKALQRTNRCYLELSPPATTPRPAPIGCTSLSNPGAKSIVAFGDSISSQWKARTCSQSLRGAGLTPRDYRTRTPRPHGSEKTNPQLSPLPKRLHLQGLLKSAEQTNYCYLTQVHRFVVEVGRKLKALVRILGVAHVYAS
jgi:hypothetical protein